MDSRITPVLKELSGKGRLSLEEKYLQHGENNNNRTSGIGFG